MNGGGEAVPLGFRDLSRTFLSARDRGRGLPPQQKRLSRKGVPYRGDGLEATPELPPRARLPMARPPGACVPSRTDARWLCSSSSCARKPRVSSVMVRGCIARLAWAGRRGQGLIRLRQARALDRLGRLSFDPAIALPHTGPLRCSGLSPKAIFRAVLPPVLWTGLSHRAGRLAPPSWSGGGPRLQGNPWLIILVYANGASYCPWLAVKPDKQQLASLRALSHVTL